MLKGIEADPAAPMKFDFYISSEKTPDTKASARKLIRYFLTALAIPPDDMWVNLSPKERERVMPEALSRTGLGKVLLETDLVLKKTAAGLLHPDSATGKDFWNRVYQAVGKTGATADVPLDEFNKVWIVPDRAVVYEDGRRALVKEFHLKVMSENDHLIDDTDTGSHHLPVRAGSPRPQSASMHTEQQSSSLFWSQRSAGQLVCDIFRETVLPVLEKEVNEGASFAELRQVFSAAVLAEWYRARLKSALLNRVYTGKNRVAGGLSGDDNARERIWRQYFENSRKGLFNLIREEPEPVTGEMVPRKYFSGGIIVRMAPEAMSYHPLPDAAQAGVFGQPMVRVRGQVGLIPVAGDMSQADKDTPLRGRKVLLVDDNAVERQEAAEWLERKGAKVVEEPTWRDAVGTFLGASGDFDAVVVDVLGPGDSPAALYLIRALRERKAVVPVVVISVFDAGTAQERVERHLEAPERENVFYGSKQRGSRSDDQGFWTNAVLRSLPPPTTGIARPLEGRRVLVIDDTGEERVLISDSLQSAGALVTEEPFWADGIRLFFESEKGLPFDAVVVDMLSDGQETVGLDVIRNIRQHNLKVPIIVVSNFSSERCFELVYMQIDLDYQVNIKYVNKRSSSDREDSLLETLKGVLPPLKLSPAVPLLTGMKILLMDDEEDSRESSFRELSDKGAEVTPVEDFSVVVPVMKTHPDGFDAVALDLLQNRQEQRGIDVLWQIRQFDPDIPVFITSDATEDEIIQMIGQKFGAVDPKVHIVSKTGIARQMEAFYQAPRTVMAPGSLSGRRVLVVQADRQESGRIAAFLQQAGATVTEETNGVRAAELLGSVSRPFDAVVASLFDSDGRLAGGGLLRSLGRAARVPAVIVTGDVPPENMAAAVGGFLGQREPANFWYVPRVAEGQNDRLWREALTTALPQTLSSERPQLVITPGGSLPPEGLDPLSEKARKYLKLHSQGLPWPEGFVLRGNGSGELVIDDELRAAWARIKKEGRTVIGRSSHPYEGRNGYPFNGQFESFKGLLYLADADVPAATPLDPEQPITLESAYRLMVQRAMPANNPKLTKYLERHDIRNFDPLEMDMVVMEEIPEGVLAMFLTSDVNNRDLVHIKTDGGDFFYDRRKGEFIGSHRPEAALAPTFQAMANMARAVEDVYGRQQVEMIWPYNARTPGEVYLLQSRTFKDNRDVPRYSRYRTLSDRLYAEGHAHVRARVVVVDDLQAATHYKDEADYRAWAQKERPPPGPARRDHIEEGLRIENAARERYMAELHTAVDGQGPYILLLKNPDSIVPVFHTPDDPTTSRRAERGFFNELLSSASAVVMRSNIVAVAHELWDPQESGGTVVTVPREESDVLGRFVHRPTGSVLAGPAGIPSQRPLVEVIPSGEIRTRDDIELLSNSDGVFLAPVNAANPNGVNGADAAMAAGVASSGYRSLTGKHVLVINADRSRQIEIKDSLSGEGADVQMYQDQYGVMPGGFYSDPAATDLVVIDIEGGGSVDLTVKYINVIRKNTPGVPIMLVSSRGPVELKGWLAEQLPAGHAGVFP
jgi:CheY-like chemotaxis protein